MALRDYVDGQIGILVQRMDDADKATEVLSETINRTPTEIQKEVAHVKELLSTKLDIAEAKIIGYRDIQVARTAEVDKHFEHLDKVRSEDKREARALVDLALSAQKEASSVALTSANTAIEKAAQATDKRYDALDKAVAEMRADVSQMMPRKESEARHSAHETAVNTLTSQVVAVVNQKQGGKEQLTGMYALAGFIVSLIAIAGMLAAAGAFKS